MIYAQLTSLCSGEPTGTITKIGTIETYIAEPKGQTIHKETAILYLTDAFGIWQNSKLIADQYAANGYHTIIPDLFNGDPLNVDRPAGFDFPAWMQKGTTGDNPHTTAETDLIVEKALEYLKGKGYKKIGAVGYCWVSTYLCC